MKNLFSRMRIPFAGAIALTGILTLLLAAACALPDNPERKVIRYAISVNAPMNGTVSADKESAEGGETVILHVIPDEKYKLGSIRIIGVSGIDIIPKKSGNVYSFTMPDEDVFITALFVSVVQTNVDDEGTALYDIVIEQTSNGSIDCEQTNAAPGEIVTLILTPDDEYQYSEGSLIITSDEGEIIETSEPVDNDDPPAGDNDKKCSHDGRKRSFIMPENDVNITATFEEIPNFTITIASCENGVLSVSGAETDDRNAGMAEKGTVITVTAIPNSGYKRADTEPAVTPMGAVSFTKLEGQPAWTFDMPDTDIEISFNFIELGPLEIYKGGARKGISVGELSDDKQFFIDCVNMESEENGHDGSQRAIKITHALNEKGSAVQQSFGLFSDTEIDLENVSALSFWAKANKSLNIRYVGFGDDDPDKRVVYTGENADQVIPLGPEWKQYIIPVPAPGNRQKTTRAFLFNAQLAKNNYVYIDDIEFIPNGVNLTDIKITSFNNEPFYGTADTDKIFSDSEIMLTYARNDGTTVTLQSSKGNHSLQHNLAFWLAPFMEISANAHNSTIAITVTINGITSNSIMAHIIHGFLLDGFEDLGDATNRDIPGTPAPDTGYLWHTTSAGSVVVARKTLTTAHNEIHSGLHAGSWRPKAAANNPRGGRNFEAKDISAYSALSFWIKVTTGGSVNIQKNTVFTFELRNGGTLVGKTTGVFFKKQFTYNTDNADGWQEVIIPLSDFTGLDLSAITGYAFGVVDNQNVDLRIILDDIAIIAE